MAFIQFIQVLGIHDGTTPSSAMFKLAISLLVPCFLSYSFYAIYLHPLSDYPGPKLSAISRLPYWIACLSGNSNRFMVRLHRIYGPVVRFGPDDLSYTDSRAWRDIHVVQKGKKENGKLISFYPSSSDGEHHLFTQNDTARHATVRRVFSPAFSEKGLKAQEPMFQRFSDMLVARCGWRESAAFDIMAELSFGESLGMLENNKYTRWTEMIFSSLKVRRI